MILSVTLFFSPWQLARNMNFSVIEKYLINDRQDEFWVLVLFCIKAAL